MKISYSFGIMDLFNYGHLMALKEASNGADLHVVGLVSDKAANSWLGNIVSNEHERKIVLKNISCVDWVMPQETLDPTDNLKKLNSIYPEAEITLFRGDDITVATAREYLKSIGGRVKSLDYYKKLSPNEILNSLNSRVDYSNKHINIISTKANTLLALKERVKLSKIEDIMIVFALDIEKNIETIADNIKSKFSGHKIVVRSSSTSEDCFDSSNAGHFESVLNIDSYDREAIISALQTVYNSYKIDGDVKPDEQILVQSQTDNVKCSGVIFTRDIQKNRPYYVINYDDTGSTDTVTAGVGGKTIWIARDIQDKDIPEEWRNLWQSIKELEDIFRDILLDIEFAIKSDNSIVIFQVRPLAASYKFSRNDLSEQKIKLKNNIKTQYEQYSQNSNLKVFSDMAFWNPAEIIGDNPKKLDYSLYKNIITRRAWNEGLVPMGYREVPYNLMYRFGNKPYISLEYSFMSLIPSSLPDSLAKKLQEYYLKKLQKDFSAHDKIEFEITLSCYDFNTDDKLNQLVSQQEFSKKEVNQIKEAILNLTKNNINSYDAVLKQDLKSLDKLEKIRIEIEEKAKEINNVRDIVNIIKELIDAIKLYGTPQFSRQARFAFISKAIATSLKNKKYWSESDYDNFMSTVETVATQFEIDFNMYINNKISKNDFNNKYGHLRAGTYDITSPRYDTLDFGKVKESNKKNENKRYSLNKNTNHDIDIISKIKRATIDFEVDFDIDKLIVFMRSSLEQREYFKFIFTRSLSRVIELIAKIGEKLGYGREVMSYFDIAEILGFVMYDDENQISEYIRELFLIREKNHKNASQVILPNVISKLSDFDFVTPVDSRPNFITTKKIVSEIVVLNNKSNLDIKNKIVVIEKADPGYDWIFTKGISGLITKYGGVASHMAIRCAEFEIPAAIGCGDKIFNYVVDKNKQTVEMDCKKGIIL